MMRRLILATCGNNGRHRSRWGLVSPALRVEPVFSGFKRKLPLAGYSGVADGLVLIATGRQVPSRVVSYPQDYKESLFS